MKKILISGHICMETNLQIESFPVEYVPIRYPFFGIDTAVSGVGFNVATALSVLGNEVSLASVVGQDDYAKLINDELCAHKITPILQDSIEKTAQSVILVDKNARRQVFCDLKNLQEQQLNCNYSDALSAADAVVACNINFSRTVARQAKEQGKLIAVDVHVLSDVNDEYNREFMQLSDIIFLSNEHILNREREFCSLLMQTFGARIIVVGMGSSGALLKTKDDFTFVQAVKTREIKNTVGAGDALFASFLHCYLHSGNALDALKKAVVFASYKIGEYGGAKGFLDNQSLLNLSKDIYND